MKREEKVFLAAIVVSVFLTALEGAGCLPGYIVASSINVLMIFPLTMFLTFFFYVFYFVTGKKDKFPMYYYLISLFIVTTYFLAKHFGWVN